MGKLSARLRNTKRVTNVGLQSTTTTNVTKIHLWRTGSTKTLTTSDTAAQRALNEITTWRSMVTSQTLNSLGTTISPLSLFSTQQEPGKCTMTQENRKKEDTVNPEDYDVEYEYEIQLSTNI